MKLKFEQSDKECFTDTAGLYFVGKALNKTHRCQELKKVKKRHGIPILIWFVPILDYWCLVNIILMLLMTSAMMNRLKKPGHKTDAIFK